MANTHPILKCPEPGCTGRLLLKTGRGKPFYGCENFAYTRCPGSHGAHPDGTPLGIPADQCTKRARMAAHAAFDRLWKKGDMDRDTAYRWLQCHMDLSKEEAHIGRFAYEQCERLIRLVREWES